MRHRQRHLMAHSMSIHKDRRLNMWTLQKQRDALVSPVLRHIDRTSVPRLAHIVFLWRQKKWKLHLPFLSIGLHIGIEVIRRIIERARPLSVDIHVIALAVGQHRAWQHHKVCVSCRITDGEVPHSRQTDDLLGSHMSCSHQPTANQNT